MIVLVDAFAVSTVARAQTQVGAGGPKVGGSGDPVGIFFFFLAIGFLFGLLFAFMYAIILVSRFATWLGNKKADRDLRRWNDEYWNQRIAAADERVERAKRAQLDFRTDLAKGLQVDGTSWEDALVEAHRRTLGERSPDKYDVQILADLLHQDVGLSPTDALAKASRLLSPAQ